MSIRLLFVRLVMGFSLTATGVHTSCPIELSPPSVVVRYGDPVSINCSTQESEVEGMGWEASQGGKPLDSVTHVTWTVERLTQWTISPWCFVNPSPDSSFEQCMIGPNVVLYTFPEKISISCNGSDGVMEENQNYIFTCEIPQIAPVKNLTVRWYKGDMIIHKDTFDNPSKKPVNQVSVFNFTATRQDEGVTFRCEAHMDLGPVGPQLNVSSQEYTVTVHFGPDVQCSHIELQEGKTLESMCLVEGNPTPDIRWLKDGQHVDLSKPLRRKDAGLYFIEAEGFSSTQKQIQVVVLYGPELKCPPTFIALEHAPHNFTCTGDGYPKPEIIWSRDGEEVELPENLARHDAGQYVITASNYLLSVNNTVEIIIVYPPSQIVELEDTQVEVGSDFWLKCSSMGSPRPQYFWNYYRMANVIEETEDGVSRLLIHNATAYNMGSYTCYASNERGNVSKTVRVTVRGAKPECPIEITPNRMVLQYQGKSQNAKCKPTDTRNFKEIYWQVTTDRKIDNESWLADTHQGWDLSPSCTARFEGIGTCSKTLNFTLYKKPDSVFIRHVHNLRSVVVGTQFQLQCDIINVAPVQNLAVLWYRGNDIFEPLHEGSIQVTSCLPDDNTNCDISMIRSPANVTSTISISLNKNPSSVLFTCEAQLNLGSEGPQPPPYAMSSPLNITVNYKPTINTTKIPKTIPVFRGYPEELVCEADGHPPPKIQWLYSPDKLVTLSGNTLIVFEAGLYNCTATNEVDSVFHVVEVISKEDYLPLIAGFVAVTVVAISVIFLFIYSIYYKNTRMRRYSLKNPKLSTHNGNVAHNGWDLQFPMTKLS